jgi:sorbitol/mannitol transport system permease protein
LEGRCAGGASAPPTIHKDSDYPKKERDYRTNRLNRSKYITYPAIVIVALITQIPFAITIVFSFLRWKIKRPDLKIIFTGFDNYARIFTTWDFYHVLLNTAIIIFVTLFFCTVLSVLLGLLFSRQFFGVYIFRTLIVLPYFVMDSVVGIVWKTLFLNPSFGFNHYLSRFFGVDPPDFLGRYSLITVIVLIIWQWTPFFFMIVMAGLQNISEEILESARMDGAAGLRMLTRIKIPLIRGHINVAMTLGLINILKVFGLVYVTTQGGPGVSSSNLPYHVYRNIFFDWNVGRAAGIAVITVLITIFIIQTFFGRIRKKEVL